MLALVREDHSTGVIGFFEHPRGHHDVLAPQADHGRTSARSNQDVMSVQALRSGALQHPTQAPGGPHQGRHEARAQQCPHHRQHGVQGREGRVEVRRRGADHAQYGDRVRDRGMQHCEERRAATRRGEARRRGRPKEQTHGAARARRRYGLAAEQGERRQHQRARGREHPGPPPGQLVQPSHPLRAERRHPQKQRHGHGVQHPVRDHDCSSFRRASSSARMRRSSSGVISSSETRPVSSSSGRPANSFRVIRRTALSPAASRSTSAW